jgi:hypothetical protein
MSKAVSDVKIKMWQALAPAPMDATDATDAWTRVQRRKFSARILEGHGVPFFEDPKNLDFLTITRKIPKEGLEVLHRHTKGLREKERKRPAAPAKWYRVLGRNQVRQQY